MHNLLLHILLLPVIGCGGSAPAPPPPAPPLPEQADAGVIQARDAELLRRRAARSTTLLTGPQGVAAPAPVQTKTLLGQ